MRPSYSVIFSACRREVDFLSGNELRAGASRQFSSPTACCFCRGRFCQFHTWLPSLWLSFIQTAPARCPPLRSASVVSGGRVRGAARRPTVGWGIEGEVGGGAFSVAVSWPRYPQHRNQLSSSTRPWPPLVHSVADTNSTPTRVWRQTQPKQRAVLTRSLPENCVCWSGGGM